MRILLINQCHYRRGGADIVYLSTIDLLRSYGHEVACFSTINDKNEATEYKKYFIESLDIRKASIIEKAKFIKPYLYNKLAYDNIKKLIEEFKPDVAHVHLFYATLSVSILEALSENHIPIVHTVHDYRLLCPVNSMLDMRKNTCELCGDGTPLYAIRKKCSEGKLSQSFVSSLEGMYWRRINSPVSKINHFHFVSEFCKNMHIKYLPEISEKSSVFYNFTDLVYIDEKKHSDRYFLYYGRLSSEKGILTLVESWKMLSFDFKLLIVGEGSLSDKINEYVGKNNLTNIKLIGYKKGEELYSIIRKAYFVIVPSECFENNPMTIIEANSLGVPVIGANIGGIPEIIKQNETGFIFEPNNVFELKDILIKANCLNSEEYSAFTRNAMKFAKDNFRKEHHYECLIKVYNEAIKKVDRVQFKK